ncbi:MAG: hypothetical protein H3C62_13095 [Gemmatimonadaceae bacterium]|nr:hypothetical protein [Gemmatimonadaceae bacterium]
MSTIADSRAPRPRIFSPDEFAALLAQFDRVVEHGGGYGDTVFWARDWRRQFVSAAVPIADAISAAARTEVARWTDALCEHGLDERCHPHLVLLRDPPVASFLPAGPDGVWINGLLLQTLRTSVVRNRLVLHAVRAPRLLAALDGLLSALMSGHDARPLLDATLGAARHWVAQSLRSMLADATCPETARASLDAVLVAIESELPHAGVGATRDSRGVATPHVRSPMPSPVPSGPSHPVLEV